jgi:hypothetical protein
VTAAPIDAAHWGQDRSAVRHLGRAVGETARMHRVSDRAERRVRAQREWAA